MTSSRRALALGVAAGLMHPFTKAFIVQDVAGGAASMNSMLLDGVVATVLLLAVIPGIPLYGGLEYEWDDLPVRRVAVLVGIGAGAATVVADPAFIALAADQPVTELYRPRFLGMWLVNAISPTVYAGLAVVAGTLYADHEPEQSLR